MQKYWIRNDKLSISRTITYLSFPGDAIGFIKTNESSNRLGPNIQYHINSVAPYSDYGSHFHIIFGFKKDNWSDIFYKPHYAKDAVTILPIGK